MSTEIASDLILLHARPKFLINVYLLGDVLIDSGSRLAETRIAEELEGCRVTAHALTHAHPDHQGSSHALCNRFHLPLWCGAGDADAMECGAWERVIPVNWNTKIQHRYWTGPPHPVDRRLKEGDDVAGFTVLDTPGHSPGHVSYWRERDRLLVLGDVLNGMSLKTALPGMHEPPASSTCDSKLNRRSIRKLAALAPETVCFGHGPPLRNAADKLKAFADRLRD